MSKKRKLSELPIQECTQTQRQTHTDTQTLAEPRVDGVLILKHMSADDPFFKSEDGNFEIKTSTIPNAGNGAFAKIQFEAKQLIGHYGGEPLTTEMRKQRYPNGGQVYSLHLNNEIRIDAADPYKSNWARYMNSTRGTKRATNARFGVRCAEIRATRTIKVGDEILIGYGNSYWRNKPKV
jgi:hypothetical protein